MPSKNTKHSSSGTALPRQMESSPVDILNQINEHSDLYAHTDGSIAMRHHLNLISNPCELQIADNTQTLFL